MGTLASMKTAGLMGSLQFVVESVRFRRVFYVQPYQPFNRLLPAPSHNIFVGTVDKPAHDFGDGHSAFPGQCAFPVRNIKRGINYP